MMLTTHTHTQSCTTTLNYRQNWIVCRTSAHPMLCGFRISHKRRTRWRGSISIHDGRVGLACVVSRTNGLINVVAGACYPTARAHTKSNITSACCAPHAQTKSARARLLTVINRTHTHNIPKSKCRRLIIIPYDNLDYICILCDVT